MKKKICLLIGMLLPLVVWADFKTAFVDGNQIMQQYEPIIEKKLRKEFTDQEDKLTEAQQSLLEKSQRFNRDAAILTDREKADLQTAFEKEQTAFQKRSAEYNQARTKRANEELQKLLDEVRGIVAGMAKTSKYDVVFQRGAAVYYPQQSDITGEVMKQIKYK